MVNAASWSRWRKSWSILDRARIIDKDAARFSRKPCLPVMPLAQADHLLSLERDARPAAGAAGALLAFRPEILPLLLGSMCSLAVDTVVDR
jgi:hypothetical protein